MKWTLRRRETIVPKTRKKNSSGVAPQKSKPKGSNPRPSIIPMATAVSTQPVQEVVLGNPSDSVRLDIGFLASASDRIKFIDIILYPSQSLTFCFVRYLLDDIEQPFGLTFDMGKRIFIDYLGDEELDRYLKEISPKISDVIADYLRSRVNAF